MGEADDEDTQTGGASPERGATRYEPAGDRVIADDRPRDELREHRDVDGDREKITAGGDSAAMDVDQVAKAELAAEAVWTAERLGGEPRQVLDVFGVALAEQRLQHWIGENT